MIDPDYKEYASINIVGSPNRYKIIIATRPLGRIIKCKKKEEEKKGVEQQVLASILYYNNTK